MNKKEQRKTYLRKWTKLRRVNNKRLINSLKDVPCMDCGKKYPHYVMDFDHRDGNLKDATLTEACRNHWSVKRIMKEVAKCDVVCANCHRERSAKRRKIQLSRIPQ